MLIHNYIHTLIDHSLMGLFRANDYNTVQGTLPDGLSQFTMNEGKLQMPLTSSILARPQHWELHSLIFVACKQSHAGAQPCAV